jgi:hypothetical protein
MARALKRLLSRRFLQEFGALQTSVRDLGAQRSAVLRIFVLSRNVTTPETQLDYWHEFTWLDQEYRIAVQRLARFCQAQQQGPPNERRRHTVASAPSAHPLTIVR